VILIGELERLLAQLWPLRVPLAVGVVVIAAIVLLVAYRRGWHRTVMAHPRLSIAVVVAFLVIALPLGWVLGSPLFIRSELIEEPPVAASADGSARVVLEGDLVGADDFHFGSGHAGLMEAEPGTYVLHLSDFSVQNGPDLFVYLSPDPDTWTPDAVNLGALKATDGSFSYEVPAGVDPAHIASAIIWCRAFSVLFATATLEPPS
jgi:hypothetical protein